MYKLTNIAAVIGKGYLYHDHSTLQSPSACAVSIEPQIGQIQLKLYESYTISDEAYMANEKYFKELIDNRIIEAVQISVEKPIVVDVKKEDVQPKVEEIKESSEEIVSEIEEESKEESENLQLNVVVQKKKKKVF